MTPAHPLRAAADALVRRGLGPTDARDALLAAHGAALSLSYFSRRRRALGLAALKRGPRPGAGHGPGRVAPDVAEGAAALGLMRTEGARLEADGGRRFTVGGRRVSAGAALWLRRHPRVVALRDGAWAWRPTPLAVRLNAGALRTAA